ncbi:hypothetical protein evm_007183 [Chilo suppressalis]|nr:hypothetical protein evm_007183 [Chilo suppressalis]
MTTDLCAEDVVIQMSPQVEMTTEAGGEVRTGTGAGGAASASLELGRHLLVAARDGHTQLVLDLMAKGAPFTTDWLGTGPLHLAAGGDHAHTAGVLLRAGVSRDSRTKVERTPLHVAAHAGHAESAGVLLRHGALVDCRDLLRMTPLHWAADRGHAEVVGLLIQHGADPAAVSKFNKTPGQLAMRRGHAAIVAMLEDAVRQREAARSVRALVEERLAEEQPTTDPLTLYKENVVEKIPEIITTTTATEVPKHCHIKATKVKKAPEKPAKMEEKLQAFDLKSDCNNYLCEISIILKL